jgi:hypothetical protein
MKPTREREEMSKGQTHGQGESGKINGLKILTRLKNCHFEGKMENEIREWDSIISEGRVVP